MPPGLLHITARAPASVANLGSGYDCLALAVDLWNKFELFAVASSLDGNQEFTLDAPFSGAYGTDDVRMRTPDSNLFVKSFVYTRKYLCDRAGVETPRSPCFIAQRVSIPPIRGLGSSSSACVAGTLAAFSYLAYHYDLSGPQEWVRGLRPNVDDEHQVHEVQASLAMVNDGCPDNLCASLVGGLTYSFSECDERHRYSLDPTPLHFFRDEVADESLRCVALVPNKTMRTREARDVLEQESYAIKDVVFNLTRSTCLPRVLRERRYDLLRDVTSDRIHQARRTRLNYKSDAGRPIDLPRVFEAVLDQGAYAAFVGGAGSTLVALAHEDRVDSVKRVFRAAFEAVATDWEVDSLLSLAITNKGTRCTSALVEHDVRLERWLDRLPPLAPPPRTGLAMRGQAAAADTKVFVSHVTEDAAVVGRLKRVLGQHGIQVFETPDIDGGTLWKGPLHKAIVEGAGFVACFSHNSKQRRASYMWEELTVAIDEYRQRPPDIPWLIPVTLDDVDVPGVAISNSRTLRDLQCIRLHPDFGAGMGRLVAAITAAIGTSQ